MTTQSTPASSAREIFTRSLEYISSAKIQEWVGLFTDDGVLEFPFPLPGFPERVEGTTALQEYMKIFPTQLKVEFSEPVYYETADPGLLIAEFTSEGTALMTGNKFRQRYLSILWIRDGKISRYRDFWNPWVIIDALGGPEVLAQATAG